MMSRKTVNKGLQAYHALAVPLEAYLWGRDTYNSRCPHVTQWLSFINTGCSHKAGKNNLKVT